MITTILLIFSILAGQLIKFPLFGIQGSTLLDVWVCLFSIIGTFKIKFRLKKPSLVILSGLLFCLVAILSLIFTPLHLSTLEYLISFSYTLRFLLYLYLGWIIYSNAFPKFRKQISKTLLMSGIGFAILGIGQFIFFPNLKPLQNLGWDPHYFRTVSTFLDPNFAGAFFVLTLLLIGSGKKTTKLAIVFFVTVYIALLTTFSRSSYLMFLISGLSFSFLKKSRVILFSTVILFFLLLAGFKTYSELVAKPRGIDRGQSASFRLNTWQQGLTLFQESPILGIGFNSYRYALTEYHLADLEFLQSRGASTNDSSLIYLLSTTGLIGTIAYSLFLFSLIKTGIKNNAVLPAAIFGLIPHSFFANSFFYPFILLWIVLKAADIAD